MRHGNAGTCRKLVCIWRSIALGEAKAGDDFEFVSCMCKFCACCDVYKRCPRVQGRWRARGQDGGLLDTAPQVAEQVASWV